MSECACGARLAPLGMAVPAGTTMCATCAARAVAGPAAVVRPSAITGALVGLLAAVVAAAAWYGIVAVSGYQLGLIAVAVGWVVAQAVVLGGRGRGATFQGLAVALTLASMAVAEYLVSWHFANEFLTAEGLGPVPLVLPLADALAVVPNALTADPLTLLFWLVAVVTAWRVVGPAKQA